MKTMQIAGVGDVLEVKAFAFTNKGGGTGMSNWQWNEQFHGVAKVRITKLWHDYECGVRGHAVPHNDPALEAYLARNAKEQKIYWSQFDMTGSIGYDVVEEHV